MLFRSGQQALTHVVILENHGNMPVNYVPMKGLEPDAVYEDMDTGRCFYGSDLMEAGMPMPSVMEEYPAYQIVFRKIG